MANLSFLRPFYRPFPDRLGFRAGSFFTSLLHNYDRKTSRIRKDKVQVSHLSLIPFLTCKDSARVQLTSIRNVFTLLSSIAVFVVGRSLFLENSDDSELELDISRHEFKFHKFHYKNF